MAARTVARDIQIREAAIRVFAQNGYHETRVSDIAKEAGVAHGLVFHYFASKERLLASIFEHTWGQLVEGLTRISQRQQTGTDKVAAVARLVLGSYRMAPDTVRVLILEVTRSAHLRKQVGEVQQAFDLIEQMMNDAVAAGEFRDDVPAKWMSYVLWGAIDEIVTGWVLGVLPDDDATIAEAERSTVALVCGGVRASTS